MPPRSSIDLGPSCIYCTWFPLPCITPTLRHRIHYPKRKWSYTSEPPLQFQEIVSLLATGRTPTSDPTLLANPDYTSIVNEKHRARLQSYLDDAKSRGARVVELNPAAEALGEVPRQVVIGAVHAAGQPTIPSDDEPWGVQVILPASGTVKRRGDVATPRAGRALKSLPWASGAARRRDWPCSIFRPRGR